MTQIRPCNKHPLKSVNGLFFAIRVCLPYHKKYPLYNSSKFFQLTPIRGIRSFIVSALKKAGHWSMKCSIDFYPTLSAFTISCVSIFGTSALADWIIQFRSPTLCSVQLSGFITLPVVPIFHLVVWAVLAHRHSSAFV